MESFNYLPKDIANWFIGQLDRESGDSITHLKLQKLLYYAQAWSIVIFEKSLFGEDFQAWAHGPVLPSIFQEFKKHGWNSIPYSGVEGRENEVVQKVNDLLLEINTIYGEKSAKYLEDLTHNEAPWIEARGGIPLAQRSSNIISKESMQKFYSKLHSKDGQEKKKYA